MTEKIVFFPFKGEKMCFNHIILNAIDLYEKGVEVKIVIEGKATKLVKEFIEEQNPKFIELMELEIIDSVCKACAKQMGVLDFIEKETDLKLDGTMSGHPPMSKFILEGYKVITL